MKYILEQVDEIPPDGRKDKVPAGFYEDIIRVFIENQYAQAKLTVPGKNPDGVHRRLEYRMTSGMSAVCRGDGVYLINHNLVSQNEADSEN